MHWLNAQRQTALAKSTSVFFMLSVCVSGRFDEAVIEERRKAAEAMLLFTITIPALYNSPQLKEFFGVRNNHTGTQKKKPDQESYYYCTPFHFVSFYPTTPPSIFLPPHVYHGFLSFSLPPLRVGRSQGLWIPPLCPLTVLCLPLLSRSPSGGPRTVNPQRRRRAGRPPPYRKTWAPTWA